MQLGSKETENERFAHYLTKTYRKTASLIANSLKSVSILKKRLKIGQIFSNDFFFHFYRWQFWHKLMNRLVN